MSNWVKKHLWPQFWGTLYEWQRDDAAQMAAALAFYTAFSFFPLILVLLSVLGFVLDFTQWGSLEDTQIIINSVKEYVSPQLAEQLNQIITGIADKVKNSASVSGPVGFAILFFGAIGIFANMELAFSRIWKEYLAPTKPGLWPMIKRVLYGRFKAFLVVLGLGVFIVLTFISSLVLTTVDHYLNDWQLGFATLPLVRGAGILLNFLFFLFVYRLFSPRIARWRDCMWGSIVASLFWELGRFGLEKYLLRGTYTPYGVIGSFIAVMLWFYYAWCVVFFGAEYAQVAHRIRLENNDEQFVDPDLNDALSSAQL